jgi:hypothetical protein
MVPLSSDGNSNNRFETLDLNDAFRQPVVLTIIDEIDHFCALFGEMVPVIGIDYRRTEPDLSGRRPRNKIEQPFSSAPPCILAIVTYRAACLPFLKSVHQAMINSGARSVPEPLLVDANSDSDCVRAIATAFSSVLHKQTALFSDQVREIAQLRQRNEVLQNRYQELEAFLDRKGLQPCDLAFESPPLIDAAATRAITVPPNTLIYQLLPVASNGVCAIAFHVPADVYLNNQCDVLLRTLEDDSVVERWSLDPRMMHGGWNVLSLRRSIGGLRRSLRIEISTSGDGDGLHLSLGGYQPIDRFRVCRMGDGVALSRRNLAIRVWAGLADFVLPLWFDGHSSSLTGEKQRGPVEFPLPEDVLRRLRPSRDDGAAMDFIAVDYLEDEQALLCHPPQVGVTTVNLPRCLPPGTIRVSAVVYVANQLSPPVTFELRALNCQASGNVPDAAPSVVAECSRSEPVTIAPGEERTVNLFLDPAPPHGADLHLVTRMENEGNNYYAWARFKSITLMVDNAY